MGDRDSRPTPEDASGKIMGFNKLLSATTEPRLGATLSGSDATITLRSLVRKNQDTRSSGLFEHSSVDIKNNRSPGRAPSQQPTGASSKAVSSKQFDDMLSRYSASSMADSVASVVRLANGSQDEECFDGRIPEQQGVVQYSIPPSGAQYTTVPVSSQRLSMPTSFQNGLPSTFNMPQQQQAAPSWIPKSSPPGAVAEANSPGLMLAPQPQQPQPQYVQAPQYVQYIVQQPQPMYTAVEQPQVVQHSTVQQQLPCVVYPPQQTYAVQYGGPNMQAHFGDQNVLSQNVQPQPQYQPVQVHYSPQPQMVVQSHQQHYQVQHGESNQVQQHLSQIQAQGLENGLYHQDEAGSASHSIAEMQSTVQKRKGGLGWTRQPTSSFYGVSWHKRSKKWVARLWQVGRSLYVGTYPSEVQAALAIDVYLIVLGSNASQLNFPDPAVRQANTDIIHSQGLKLPTLEQARKAVANNMAKATGEQQLGDVSFPGIMSEALGGTDLRDLENLSGGKSTTDTQESSESSDYNEAEEDTGSGQFDLMESGDDSSSRKKRESPWKLEQVSRKKKARRTGSFIPGTISSVHSGTSERSQLIPSRAKVFRTTSNSSSEEGSSVSNARLPDQHRKE
mmetsp:Transcript_6518/g.12008  ORF Transcript_6518/g.12008 Transcript_6518/m.12008 type:complete len:617 (-) Transcript_6518:121-1971(-)